MAQGGEKWAAAAFAKREMQPSRLVPSYPYKARPLLCRVHRILGATGGAPAVHLHSRPRRAMRLPPRGFVPQALDRTSPPSRRSAARRVMRPQGRCSERSLRLRPAIASKLAPAHRGNPGGNGPARPRKYRDDERRERNARVRLTILASTPSTRAVSAQRARHQQVTVSKRQ